ncbi:type IV conjugative transfer system lipoprotein TraV [Salmonella enterica]|uniref:type IV conjugative transfer system lipoprotein TraV n=1 Tax=Citrobacter sp. wls710 TaxID=2576426 RepID=UPI000CDDF954|nr:type IV conjugative transfer system lipoprotein TraV [Citrobacter sp. wls710]EBU4459571.1 type IV conjugative transfer system lipoprotein TraV [Salmonella enterica]POT24461.1 type IV conjugative transfer system protein TraV [Citrobacter freundii]EDF5197481.1 type IV conjugative transfer system lipoprotein TraV [Salmonella enterica]EFR7426780.1 type IV conjugative transfer system lipoprotein TraV [Salmonella enterica]EGB2753338.1 type IV conjugative transfer system lipoprotein TraV [Salmonel
MKKLMGAALLCSVLTGCAGMNSDFDCNKTATDQCLTTGEANKLAAQGKSLDDLTADKAAKKPAGETLPALRNVAPVVNTSRPVSVAATGSPSSKLIAPRPLAAVPAGTMQTGVTPRITSSAVGQSVPANTAGRVQAQRIPDATQRLWIAPWVDTDDNFHQPSVVEFVKNKSHWDESYRVIGEGGE